MKKSHTIYRPARAPSLTFDDLYHQISHDWHHKAQALITRRWRLIHKELKT